MEELWKKIHVTIREEDHQKLKEILPERGAFQHLVRRFIRALITDPTSDTITIPLKMSLWEADHADNRRTDSTINRQIFRRDD